MKDELQFEAAGHVYRYRGRVVPSVTQVLSVLGEYAGIDPRVLEIARQFGTHVHAACDLWNKNDLDEESLDPPLLPYLNGWRAFVADNQVRVIASELRVFHPAMRYAGTLDIAADWKGPCLIDLKSGIVPRSVGAQTAGYQQALGHNPDFPPLRRRYCLQLTGLASPPYKLIPQKNPADFSLFTSCLNVWKHLNEK